MMSWQKNVTKNFRESINLSLTRYSPVEEVRRGRYARQFSDKWPILSRIEVDGPNHKILQRCKGCYQKSLHEWKFKDDEEQNKKGFHSVYWLWEEVSLILSMFSGKSFILNLYITLKEVSTLYLKRFRSIQLLWLNLYCTRNLLSCVFLLTSDMFFSLIYLFGSDMVFGSTFLNEFFLRRYLFQVLLVSDIFFHLN